MAPTEFGDRLDKVLTAWKDLRPAKQFAGMTLAQFTAKVQPSLDTRATIDGLEEQKKVAMDQRDKADTASNEQLLLVVNAVKGDPDEGEDGELYEAMGYVRKSDRKSGLTRKKAAAAAAAK